MNGSGVGSVVGVIGLLRSRVVGDFLFLLEMTFRAGVVSVFGVGLRIACSHSVGVLWVWWMRGIMVLPLGRRSDCMSPHLA